VIIKPVIWILPFVFSGALSADGNTSGQSFNTAKKVFMKTIYANEENRRTIYCNAKFDDKKVVDHPEGFVSLKYVKRSKKIEFEHIVPAENFGRAFASWRDGHPSCFTKKGKKLTNRQCAEKVSPEFRRMFSDMYNLYAAIGSVNALRSNYNFQMLPGEESGFGSCEMAIHNEKAQPPEASRGRIARAYLYMDQVYTKYSMSKQQRKLMMSWDDSHPIAKVECLRAEKILKIQGNSNPVTTERCRGV